MAGVDNEPALPLGPWSEDQLRATAEQHRNEGAGESLPASVRFLSAVTKLIMERRAQPAANSDPAHPAIFLLKPDPDPEIVEQGLTRVRVLNNGMKPVAGKVWFVSEVANSAWRFAVDAADDEVVMQVVIEKLGGGGIPAILYEPRTNPASIRFFPQGISNPDNCRSFYLSADLVNLDAVLAEIDRCYPNHLRTPDAHPSGIPLWEDSEKFWPVENAELRIQGILNVVLATALPTCDVLPEQPDNVGRIDLLIEEHIPGAPSTVRRAAVLELKVLRSFGSTGRAKSINENNEWIQSGVRQAAEYRDQRKAAECALCCFDMRREHVGEACFDHVREEGERRNVRLRSWHIFNSSEAYRRHRGCAA